MGAIPKIGARPSRPQFHMWQVVYDVEAGRQSLGRIESGVRARSCSLCHRTPKRLGRVAQKTAIGVAYLARLLVCVKQAMRIEKPGLANPVICKFRRVTRKSQLSVSVCDRRKPCAGEQRSVMRLANRSVAGTVFGTFGSGRSGRQSWFALTPRPCMDRFDNGTGLWIADTARHASAEINPDTRTVRSRL